MKTTLTVAVVLWTSLAAHGALMYDTPGATITQNFNGAAGPMATTAWANDSTLTGWYAYQAGNTTPSFPPGPPTSIRRAFGGLTSVALYRWRLDDSATDYAFGTKPSDSHGAITIGLRLTNNTNHTLTSFTLGYTGEQWYHATGGNNNLVVSYQIGATTLNSGTWAIIPELEFNSLKENEENATIGVGINGNDNANREVFPPTTVSGIDWAPGVDLWIRWFDSNSAGWDQGLAVDDLTFLATLPEPAMAGPMGVMPLLMRRRRRR